MIINTGNEEIEEMNRYINVGGKGRGRGREKETRTNVEKLEVLCLLTLAIFTEPFALLTGFV